MRPRWLSRIAVLGLLVAPAAARADDVLHPGTATMDRATVMTLGVRWPLTGDDNFNAKVTVRYRTGTGAFRDAMPLFRVHPELVAGGGAVAEFAGSIFDLAPGTPYDVELTAHDPDGGDTTTIVRGSTRPVPATYPLHPHTVAVGDVASLQAALGAAKPGDVITLAPGTYAGEFTLNASGSADDPIIVRGADRDAVILDGGDAGGNVLAVEGSYTHVERLTLQHDNRALRFHGAGATSNVVRRVHARDVVLGFGSNANQQDFYWCDNLLEGRLRWPQVYTDDQGAHANDDGLHVEGDGHVVCHNTVTGFGDAMKVEQNLARAVDFYGNDVNGSYDNAIELDQTAGNSRCFRNRFVNTFMPLSFQPIFGGPAYAIRNLVFNAAVEQTKLHNATVGVLILNNSFVGAAYAFQVLDDTTPHEIVIENNIWVGPSPAQGGRTVNWDQPLDPQTYTIDSNGWYPDGQFHFGTGATGNNYASFAAVQAAGLYEGRGRLLGASIFASGLMAPPSYKTAVTPTDGALAPGSDAIDHGMVLPNVTDDYHGAAPDLGAQETGCPVPVYGVRPEGIDESNEPAGCSGTVSSSDGGAGGGDAGSAGGRGGTDAGEDAPNRDGGAVASNNDSAAPGAGGPPAPKSGCGCRAAGAERSSPLAAVVAFGALALIALRRRGLAGSAAR
jgi:MYXO-CTERM domain-containing protein